MALPEKVPSSAPPVGVTLDEQTTGASGTRLKVATRPAAVGATWLDLFHPGSPSELTLEARVRVIADVAGALIQIHENSGTAKAHRRHGRLTPRHVLVTVDGSACLFHVKEPFSRLLPPQPDLGYLAPELLMQSAPASQESDVFSLGVLLWEALDNGRLFPHRRAAAISRLNARSLPTPRATEEWALPLGDVALRALAYEPADRYASATAFWLALREHLPPPDGARSALSRVVQNALKLELTSEIRDLPPYLTQGPFRSSSPGPSISELAGEPPTSARYSLHPEASTRRSSLAPRPSILEPSNPAWLLSDAPAPPASSRPSARVSAPPSSGSAARTTLGSGAPSSVSPGSVSPGSGTPSGSVARGSGTPEPKPSPSRMPSVDPVRSSLRVNLQQGLADNSLPFFVTSQPAPRPFPWGALSFAALIFFGVGAAVAFGAVTALRGPRTDIVVHEAPAAAAAAPTRQAPSPPPQPPLPRAPTPPPAEMAAVPSEPASTLSNPPPAPSKPADGRNDSRRPPKRPVKAVRPRHANKPAPAEEHAKPPAGGQADPAPSAAPNDKDLESLPFVNQPY
jgi:hypothetical protein